MFVSLFPSELFCCSALCSRPLVKQSAFGVQPHTVGILEDCIEAHLWWVKALLCSLTETCIVCSMKRFSTGVMFQTLDLKPTGTKANLFQTEANLRSSFKSQHHITQEDGV